MRKEDLRLSSVEVTAVYPPLPRFTGTELGDFYTAVHERHPFESLQLHGDSGGAMSIEGQRSLEIKRDEFAYQERVESGIEVSRRNIEDLVTEAQERLKIRRLYQLKVELRALWPVPDVAQPIGETLKNTVLSLNDDQLALLGEVGGASIVLVGIHEENPHWHWTAEVAPYLSDETQLWLNVKGEFFDQIETPQVLGEMVQVTYDFLRENVARFVGTVLP